MFPLVKFMLTKDVCLQEVFIKGVQNLSLTHRVLNEKQMFHLKNMLYQWLVCMKEQHASCQTILKEGEWDECHASFRYGGIEVTAIVTIIG